MSRRAVKKETLGVALFPFLAVLICTMGVIIVMLVIVVRQASARAAADIAAAEEQPGNSGNAMSGILKERENEIADLAWKRDMIAKQRDERVDDLARIRQQLAHVEDHLQRLQEQATQLLLHAKAIDEGKQLEGAELAAAKEELARNKAAIEAAKKEVDKLKKERTEKERWFALIPYDGPNGTRRRPVYIECSEAGIVLQPEGIVLMPDDFNGPLGPGNPLDAALKTKREYLERNGERALPYPLLIVRPDGIVAYMVARAALKAWEEEFGYELIDGEKKLIYGDPDPQLAQTIAQTVRQARQRQARMVASMPGRFHREDDLESFNTADAVAQMPEMQMTGRGVGGNGNPNGGVGSGGTGQGGVGSGQGINYAAAGQGMGAGQQGGTYQAGAGSQNALRPGSPSGGTSGADGGANGGNSQYNSQANGSGNSATANGQGNASGTNGGNGGPSGQAQAGQASGGSSQWNSVAGAQGGGSGGSGSNSAGGQQGGQQIGMFTDKGSSGSSSGASGQQRGQKGGPGMPSASRKGRDWGLMNKGDKAVSVSRPIRVAVQSRQIVVMPELGDAASPVVIPVPDEELTGLEVDALVKTVQKRIEGWGIAGENSFWRPQLTMDVAANADGRYQQWQEALAGSGYEIKRKQR